jgi:hypothetical protein
MIDITESRVLFTADCMSIDEFAKMNQISWQCVDKSNVIAMFTKMFGSGHVAMMYSLLLSNSLKIIFRTPDGPVFNVISAKC